MSTNETNTQTEQAENTGSNTGGNTKVDFEVRIQRELNALPPQLRKIRVQQLRVMRRFGGPACHHPTEREIRRVFPSYR